ncbi:hypothetical protein H1C71_041970, partial [Ictidomys tridecemlineatus]
GFVQPGSHNGRADLPPAPGARPRRRRISQCMDRPGPGERGEATHAHLGPEAAGKRCRSVGLRAGNSSCQSPSRHPDRVVLQPGPPPCVARWRRPGLQTW